MRLRDITVLMLETGMRVGEVLNLAWAQVRLEPLKPARFGFLKVLSGKSKNATRNIPLTKRATDMLLARKKASRSAWVFPSADDQPYLVTSINHLHQKARTDLNLPDDFVLHALRHTMLTRLGEKGVDAFTIMRIAGHSSITVSQRYVHPSPEAVEHAFGLLEGRQAAKRAPKRQKAKGPRRDAPVLPLRAGDNEPEKAAEILPPATVVATLPSAASVSC